MLRFEREVLLADLNERTIEGVIVPFGEVGVIAGREYRFKAGSVRLGRRVPLLVDHDRGRPIGVLAELVDGPTGVVARFRVDATPAGDEALAQAASGSRGALSVGAELIRSTMSRDGVVDVEAAHVQEVSLLALGAFESAEVLRVAAEQDEPPAEEPAAEPEEPAAEPEPIETAPDQEELTLEPDDAGAAGTDPEGGTTMTEASAAAPVIRAERSPARQELNAGELVRYIVAAQQGDREARRYLEAALTDTLAADVSGLLPPTYERTVIGAKAIPRPLYTIFKGRSLPGVGLAVNKPKWTTHPDGAWALDVEADATSTKVVIGSQAAAVERWDWAGAIPWVVVQRSDPSIVDEIYGEAVQDFYDDVETKIAALLAAGSASAATTIGGGIAGFFETALRTPEVIIVAPDVWGAMADAKELDTAVGAGEPAAQAMGLTASFAGIPITASAHVPQGARYLATRRALDARVTDPVRLTANAIGALNVELAVVGEGLFDEDYHGEVVALAAGALGTQSARSSK